MFLHDPPRICVAVPPSPMSILNARLWRNGMMKSWNSWEMMKAHTRRHPIRVIQLFGGVTQICFNRLAKWEGFNMFSPFLKDGWWNHGLLIIPQVLQFFFPHLVLIFGPLWIHCYSTANLRVGLGKNGWGIPCSSSWKRHGLVLMGNPPESGAHVSHIDRWFIYPLVI